MKRRLLLPALALAAAVPTATWAQLLPGPNEKKTTPLLKAPDPHAGHSHSQPAPKLPEPAGGIASVAETTHDVGKIERGTDVKHAFKIKNTGTGALSIHAKPG